MHLNIDIDNHKSTLFLDFLRLLKKDHMINDFQVMPNKVQLTNYEKEVLEDISQISLAIKHANNGQGKKKEYNRT